MDEQNEALPTSTEQTTTQEDKSKSYKINSVSISSEEGTSRNDHAEHVKRELQELDVPKVSAKVTKWVSERGFGFALLPDGRSVFVHAKVVETPEGQGYLGRSTDLTGSLLYLEERSIQEDERQQGRWQAGKAITQSVHNSQLERIKYIHGVLERFTQEEAALQAIAPEIMQRLLPSLPNILVQIDGPTTINNEELGITIEIRPQNVQQSEFDDQKGAKVKGRSEVILKSGGTSISRYFDVESEGWRMVKISGGKGHQDNHRPHPEQETLEVCFKVGTKDYYVAYPATALPPEITDSRITQAIIAQTPKGEAKYEARIYDIHARTVLEPVWGEVSVSNLKSDLYKRAYQKLGVSNPEMVEGLDIESIDSPTDILDTIKLLLPYEAEDYPKFLQVVEQYRQLVAGQDRVYMFRKELRTTRDIPESNDGMLRGRTYHTNIIRYECLVPYEGQTGAEYEQYIPLNEGYEIEWNQTQEDNPLFKEFSARKTENRWGSPHISIDLTPELRSELMELMRRQALVSLGLPNLTYSNERIDSPRSLLALKLTQLANRYFDAIMPEAPLSATPVAQVTSEIAVQHDTSYTESSMPLEIDLEAQLAALQQEYQMLTRHGTSHQKLYELQKSIHNCRVELVLRDSLNEVQKVFPNKLEDSDTELITRTISEFLSTRSKLPPNNKLSPVFAFRCATAAGGLKAAMQAGLIESQDFDSQNAFLRRVFEMYKEVTDRDLVSAKSSVNFDDLAINILTE